MTSVIAVPETGSAAKGHRVGSRAVRARLLSERRSHLGGRPVAAGLCAALDTTAAINKTRLTRPTRSSAQLLPLLFFPLGKHQWAPFDQPSHSPARPPAGCHLNLSRPQPSALSGTLLH